MFLCSNVGGVVFVCLFIVDLICLFVYCLFCFLWSFVGFLWGFWYGFFVGFVVCYLFCLVLGRLFCLLGVCGFGFFHLFFIEYVDITPKWGTCPADVKCIWDRTPTVRNFNYIFFNQTLLLPLISKIYFVSIHKQMKSVFCLTISLEWRGP